MSDDEASASPEESAGDASEAPEEEAAPRLGLAFTDLTIESMEALADATILTTDERDARKRFGAKTWSRLTDQASFTRTWGDCYGYLLLAYGKADVMIDPIVNSWDFHVMLSFF